MTSLRVLPSADADVDQAAAYYADNASLEVALRFLDAVRGTYAFLTENPLAGAQASFVSPRLLGVRRWRVADFDNYLVFYRVTDSCIEVLRVLHGARDIEAILQSDESLR